MKAVARTVEQEIIGLHIGIISSLRNTVEDAVRIGELISKKKVELDHGEFLPWLGELPFSQNTASNYVNLFGYKNKLTNVVNLTEAYKVARLEDQRVKGKRAAPKPKPVPITKPIIDDQEYERRKEEALVDEKPTRPLDEVFEDVKKVLIQQETEEVFRDFDLAGLIQELRRRILTIEDVSRRHQAVNQIIKAMRELAVECERLSMGSKN